ncbi:MAG: tryptophan--tRNA ligase [Myxococcales bacterium]|nr:tryptophan--tRNA ligase [Myxococcales bacterium]MCB9569698.1 tryptophan--tRNA ligase [Myxococcales bacterium]MCB9700503.1 tryptophan--tRNA ligase [Myxococcales bacterium]
MNVPASAPSATTGRRRLLTGDRPTGPLHLGHLVGTLHNRVQMQENHDCWLIVADLHSLTTRSRREQIGELPELVREVVVDLLSVGIDPQRSTIYLQSGVPAVYDLAILLQMLIPASRLRGIPTIQDMARNAGITDDEVPLGLLGYPVLQAADILMARAEVVPVGGDNEAHVAIAREIAEHFNALYGPVFPIPQAMVSSTPTLPGVDIITDGSRRKMSKSAGNSIRLKDTPEEVARKVATLQGPGAGKSTPEALERSPLFAFVDAFVTDRGVASALKYDYLRGTIDDGRVHEAIIADLEGLLRPIRQRRAELTADPGRIEEIVVDGTIRAREVAYQTLGRVRDAMGLEGLWNGLVEATQKRAEARRRPY